jgi:hypothetical protein
MLKQIFGLLLIATLAFVSCTKDSFTVSEEELADSIIDTRTDSLPCFEFVFPVSFQLPDQSIAEVNSLEEAKVLRDSIKGKLKLVYPVEIINSNGENVSIASHEEMHTILEDCGLIRDNGGHKGKGGDKGGKGIGGIFRNNDCFTFVFPISVQLSDSSIVQIDSLAEAQILVKAEQGKIRLIFPFNILNSLGETVTITNPEDLHKVLENCKPDHTGGFGNGGHQGGNGGNHNGNGGNHNGNGGNHNGNGGQGDHNKCFELVFPLSIVFPDGTVTSYSDETSMQTALQPWRKFNPKAVKKPEFQFPIKVILNGATESTTVNSKEELEALRKNC